MRTRWSKTLDDASPLPEYPRPQLVRKSYVNLNGSWDCALTDSADFPRSFDGRILVPFSPESELSGIGRSLKPTEYLWYRRFLILPDGFNKGRILLHFGAVDQIAAVYVNGTLAVEHIGGFTAFSVDITTYLAETNELLVRVRDLTDTSWQSRGKQRKKRGGIWYTPQSGIWQTVWLESVPEVHIESLLTVPKFDDSAVEITVNAKAHTEESCVITLAGREYEASPNIPCLIPMPDFTAWSPENPHLYGFSVRLGADSVQSYFGMRKFGVEKDEQGVPRLFLNGRPCFHNGLLDQGYYSDGMLTPPADEAMIFDIQTAKDMGFNMLRKHIKLEPMRWYYHCDRLGMLVWQDMPNGGGKYNALTISSPLITGKHFRDSRYALFARRDAAGREQYYAELDEMLDALISVPCIAVWVPFNEGWGQFDAAEAVRRIEAKDKTRTIDHASGWHDQKIGQVKSLHVYFKKYRHKPDKLGRAVILSEFGGYSLYTTGHCFNDRVFGYKRLENADALWDAYERLYREQIIPAKAPGLAAAVYTQLTDVEGEVNGLITYDREVVKLPVEKLRALNAKLGAHTHTLSISG